MHTAIQSPHSSEPPAIGDVSRDYRVRIGIPHGAIKNINDLIILDALSTYSQHLGRKGYFDRCSISPIKYGKHVVASSSRTVYMIFEPMVLILNLGRLKSTHCAGTS